MARQNNNHISRTQQLARYSRLHEPAPPLTATARIYAGPGVGLAEIQITVEPPSSNKGKILAVGIPRVEIEQVLQSVLRIPGLVGRPDYDITGRLVGAEKYQSSFGMGVSIAIISSYLRKPIASDFIFLGEIDLMRNVRGGSTRQIANLHRSIEASEVDADISLVLPVSLDASRLAHQGVQLIPCANLIDVIQATWKLEQ